MRALLEGIAYEIRNNLDIVEGQIGEAEQIHIGGGLSNSHEFNQIQADVYGRKLIQYQHREAGSLEHGQAQWWKAGRFQIIRKL